MVDMLLSPFMEAPLKGASDSGADDNDCLFDSEDVYSQWGLLTPPWSPCDSSMDTGDDCDFTLTDTGCPELSTTTTRTRCDSFLCSCTSCECSCLEHVDGPVLRDCMWSQTTGLLPLLPMIARPPSTDAPAAAAEQSPAAADGPRPCCPAITTVCSNHTDRCVDPKSVFPFQSAGLASSIESYRCSRAVSASVYLTTGAYATDCSTTSSQSPVYDPDSETSAYCSSFSDDELEEIDVVSVPSCGAVGGWSVEPVSLVDHPARRQQVLVLPAAESMSAQVAAMHNYSNPRCQRPVPMRRTNTVSMASVNTLRHTAKCASPSRPRRRPRRVAMTAVSSPASDWSSDSGSGGAGPIVDEDERHKRAQHNVMERQRRYHLKSHFYCLRDVVPGTRGDGRVSKVAILRRAVDYVRHLQTTHDQLEAEYRRQQAVQERSKWKLSLLNRDARCAAAVSCA